jgi:hypothetical protein
MNSNLISKNISGYFDELINKPIITLPQKQSSMSIFYKNYVEHNLLLIFIIIFIIIFLLFKYFTKNNNLDNDDNNIDNDEKKMKKKENKNKLKEKKFREKIYKEKKLLEKEKSEILSIIDELSEMNYKRVIPQNIHEEENLENNRISNNENNSINNNENNKISNNKNNRISNKNNSINNNQNNRISNNNKNMINYNSLDNNFEAYTNNENYSDDYYDIKENKSELIDGVYFETPYN